MRERDSRNENIKKAIFDISLGKMVVVLDDESRENEADLIMAGEKVTPELINFMIRKARGLICVPITMSHAEKLDFHPMLAESQNKYPRELHGCNFAISVDVKNGTTTGISAFDRTKTILAIANKQSQPQDFARPGHIFPVVAVEGGVLERPGHTEASVELVRLAGLTSVAVICEILRDDGDMARGNEAIEFAHKHNLSVINIKDLVEYVKK